MVAKQLQAMDLNEEERENMTTFLEDKRKIIQHGELKEGDFVRLTELGYGNGGVVLKVEHKPSQITMARKVTLLFEQHNLLYALGNFVA